MRHATTICLAVLAMGAGCRRIETALAQETTPDPRRDYTKQDAPRGVFSTLALKLTGADLVPLTDAAHRATYKAPDGETAFEKTGPAWSALALPLTEQLCRLHSLDACASAANVYKWAAFKTAWYRLGSERQFMRYCHDSDRFKDQACRAGDGAVCQWLADMYLDGRYDELACERGVPDGCYSAAVRRAISLPRGEPSACVDRKKYPLAVLNATDEKAINDRLQRACSLGWKDSCKMTAKAIRHDYRLDEDQAKVEKECAAEAEQARERRIADYGFDPGPPPPTRPVGMGVPTRDGIYGL